MADEKKIYFYPVWLRIWHGINALCIITLIFTGLSMQSNIETNQLGFKQMVMLHNIAGSIVAIGYVFYVIANIVTKNGRFYLIKFKGFLKRPIKQAYYYAWGMFHGMSAPFPLSEKRKFNPLQKYFYVLVMYFAVPLVIISGIGLLFPELIIDKLYSLSGVFVTAVLHSSMGFFISIFLIIHLYVASIGKSPLENFKSMINGWHQIH